MVSSDRGITRMTNEQKVETPLEAEEFAGTNVVPFRRKATSGGGFPPSGGSGSGDWLGGLEVGSRFLAKRVGEAGSEVDDYVVGGDNKGGVVLLAKNISGMGKFEWHDTALFSRTHRLYMVLEVINDDDKQIQSGRLDQYEESTISD